MPTTCPTGAHLLLGENYAPGWQKTQTQFWVFSDLSTKFIKASSLLRVYFGGDVELFSLFKT